MTHLHPGLPIGGYELVSPLGKGGMAEVWLARRQGSLACRHVAIKLIADQHVGDPAYRRMFRAEAELSGLLTHANIVQVFQEGEEHGRSFLVMEWVDGVSLVRVRSALAVLGDAQRHRIAAYIVGQLLHALAYAHDVTTADGESLGIVHRDVSPQNVLVSNQGEVKLTDFGVAHHVLEESSGLHVKGKLRYMAPEQLAGSTRAPAIDLYAVGAILHELLDGEQFRAEARDEPHMMGLVLRGVMPTLSREVPPELDVLRRGLLEPSPELRIPSADTALELLAWYPGYRDARRELMQLCRALTGVDKPRSGPAEVTTQEATPPLVRAARARAPGVPIAVEVPAPGSEHVPSEQPSAPLPAVDSAFVEHGWNSLEPRSAVLASVLEDAAPEHIDADGSTVRTDASSVSGMSAAVANGAASLAAMASESQAELTEVTAPTSMSVTTISPTRGRVTPVVEPRPAQRRMLVAPLAMLGLGGSAAVGLMLILEQRGIEASQEADADGAGSVIASSVETPDHDGDSAPNPKPSVETNPGNSTGSGSAPLRHDSAKAIEQQARPEETPETAPSTSANKDTHGDPPASNTDRPSGEATPPLAVHTTPTCVSARKRAASSAAEWSWVAVIEATKRRECWPRTERGDWRALRIKALAEEKHFEECARLGREGDEAVRRQGRVCQEQVKR